MTRVGVVLSGCGVFDGAEIHESVITLLALERAGAEVICMAPDVDQMHVINHLTGKESGETRNVLVESARIARGEIRDVAEVQASELDAIMFPGGFGAAKNLCDFAVAGAAAEVHPEVARLVREIVGAKKPLGAICIAPALVAAVLRGTGTRAELTIGSDADTAAALEAMGAEHIAREQDEICVDAANNIISTPAYMFEGGLARVAAGIDQLVSEVLERVAAVA